MSDYSDLLKRVEFLRSKGASSEDIGRGLAGIAGIDYEGLLQSGGTPDDILVQMITPQEPRRTGAEIDAAAYRAAKRGVGTRDIFVPLGSALMDPVSGIKQLAGDQEAGERAAGANAAIEREYPFARTAGKIGLTAPVVAATAPIAAGTTGAAGLVARAGVAGGTMAGVRATDPMAEGESRAREAAAAGVVGAALSPVGEAAAKVVGAVVQRIKSARISASDLHLDSQLRVELKQQGIDWNKLGKDMQAALRQSAKDALGVDPALARAAQAQSLPVPVTLTRGQATRIPEQQLDENQLIPYSPALQGRLSEQNALLQENLQRLGEGGSADRMAAGVSVKDMMSGKLDATKQAVTEAYDLARTQAGGNVVRPQQFVEWLYENRANPGVASLISRAKDVGALTIDDAGRWTAGKVTLDDLYKVRSVASALQRGKGSEAHFAGQGKGVLDDIFEAEGGDLYRNAAALRRAQAAQFDERAIPAALTGRRGQEASVADETAIDKIIGQPVQKILDFRQAAIRGNEERLGQVFKDPELRRQGVQALKDLRASTVEWLRVKAGGENFRPGQLVKAYRDLGKGDEKVAFEKASALLGPKAAKQLRDVVAVAKSVAYDSDFVAKGSARFNTNIAKKFGDWLSQMAMPEAAATVIANVRAQAQGARAATFRPSDAAKAGKGQMATRGLSALAGAQEEARAP